jgi:MATE family multidrug resistance protein
LELERTTTGGGARVDRASAASSPRTSLAGWWLELREVSRLALPVVLVQVGQLMFGIVDTMMLGRVSKEALAAGALGHGVSFGILAVPMGLLMALDPLVSQAHGARDRERTARHVARGLVAAVYLSLPTCLFVGGIGPFLGLLGQQPELVPLASEYLWALVPGIPAFLLFLTLRQTLQAMSVVRPAMVAVMVANAVNVVANYVLIFGALGIPPLGVLGSALATSISRWTMFLVLAAAAGGALHGAWRPHLREAWRPRSLRDILRIGLPISLHQSLEFWLFTTVGLLMGALGAAEFAGHQIALNLAALSFMVPLGIAGAAATRVGNAVGRLDGAAARRASVVCLLLGAAVMVVSAAAFYLVPGPLARLFTPDAEVVAMAALLIPVAAAFQIADGTQVVGAGVLRGASDTRFAALCAFLGFWVLGLPTGVLLTFRFDLGPAGLWWGLTAGLAGTAALLVLRIRRRLRRPVAELLAERGSGAVSE